MLTRHYTLLDKFITQAEGVLNTVFAEQIQTRPNPAADIADVELTASEKRQSQGFMRVNHTGEVCAQALYRGQLVFAEDEKTEKMLSQAAIEETDHLAWTHQRLKELETHRSYLNLFWYLNSFMMGMLAAKIGDQWSLGFVEETEKQVEKHLNGHLEKLSQADLKSRAIIEKMRDDEIHHGQNAKAAGSAVLPIAVRTCMRLHAKVMTMASYFV